MPLGGFLLNLHEATSTDLGGIPDLRSKLAPWPLPDATVLHSPSACWRRGFSSGTRLTDQAASVLLGRVAVGVMQSVVSSGSCWTCDTSDACMELLRLCTCVCVSQRLPLLVLDLESGTV